MTDVAVPAFALPNPRVNIKLVPSDPDWPETQAMNHVDFGEFYPGEIKSLANDERIQRLLNSGEFEVTEEEPNSDVIRQELAQKRADLAAKEVDEAEKAGVSVQQHAANKRRADLQASLGPQNDEIAAQQAEAAAKQQDLQKKAATQQKAAVAAATPAK